GADALRFYLLSSPIVAAENLNFSERDLADVSRNAFRMLWNSYSFFTMYASIDQWVPKKDASVSEKILDRWILSELQLLIQEVDGAMGRYELSKATRLFTPFIDNLSNWYIRRSRKRFWKSEDDSDKENAYQTLYDVLVTLAKVMAPFTPFLSEEIYKNLTGEESVHLADWPAVDEKLIDERLNEEMKHVRDLVTLGLKLRADAKIKVRQPLSKVSVKKELSDDLKNIIKDELNIKDVAVDDSVEMISLDTTLDEALRLEGEAREIIRAIQEGRKKAGFNVEDRIVLGYQGKEKVFEMFGEMIQKEILATSVQKGDVPDAEYADTIELEGSPLSFFLKRI
ncbi:MAG: class I tRNA ligase family protein, partial [Candidatus Moraniibacteriota bacterium]